VRDRFAVVRDDLQLRERQREVVRRGKRSRRCRRDFARCRRDVRAGRIKAMRRGFQPGRHEWQKIGLRVSLMADRF